MSGMIFLMCFVVSCFNILQVYGYEQCTYGSYVNYKCYSGSCCKIDGTWYCKEFWQNRKCDSLAESPSNRHEGEAKTNLGLPVGLSVGLGVLFFIIIFVSCYKCSQTRKQSTNARVPTSGGHSFQASVSSPIYNVAGHQTAPRPMQPVRQNPGLIMTNSLPPNQYLLKVDNSGNYLKTALHGKPTDDNPPEYAKTMKANTRGDGPEQKKPESEPIVWKIRDGTIVTKN